MTAALGLLISGCQNNTPARTKVQAEAEFRRDAINIVHVEALTREAGVTDSKILPKRLLALRQHKLRGLLTLTGLDSKLQG